MSCIHSRHPAWNFNVSIALITSVLHASNGRHGDGDPQKNPSHLAEIFKKKKKIVSSHGEEASSQGEGEKEVLKLP